MKHIALLGNSHVAAWKLGWNEIRDEFPDIDLTFFAADGERLGSTRAENGRLVIEDPEVADVVSMTSGGKRDVAVDEYDAFGVVGFRFGINAVAALYPKIRADSHAYVEGRYTLVSDDCFAVTARDVLEQTLGFQLVRRLCELTSKPVVIGTQPAPSEQVARLRENGLTKAREHGDDARLRDVFQLVCGTLQADNVRIIDQPSETLASPLLSKQEYQRGNEHIADFTHMNGRFGALALTNFLRDVAQ